MQTFIEDKLQSVAERSVDWSNRLISSWNIDHEDGWQTIDMLIREYYKCLHFKSAVSYSMVMQGNLIWHSFFQHQRLYDSFKFLPGCDYIAKFHLLISRV
jgi:hypothetical protein